MLCNAFRASFEGVTLLQAYALATLPDDGVLVVDLLGDAELIASIDQRREDSRVDGDGEVEVGHIVIERCTKRCEIGC